MSDVELRESTISNAILDSGGRRLSMFNLFREKITLKQIGEGKRTVTN